MANLVTDISLGKSIEYHDRVNSSDPTNAVLVLLVLAEANLEADSLLRAYATLSALLAGASAEVTNTGYNRIILDDTDIVASVTDTSLHRTTVTFPIQTFPTISAGDSWSKLVVGYDSDSTGGTDANIIPVAFFDLRIEGVPIVPNGNDIIVAAPDGYIVAS
jgi:hypothetical protein